MDGTILLLPVKCATMCAYMSVLSHSPSFPPLQYNDKCYSSGGACPTGWHHGCGPKWVGRDADEWCNLLTHMQEVVQMHAYHNTLHLSQVTQLFFYIQLEHLLKVLTLYLLCV